MATPAPKTTASAQHISAAEAPTATKTTTEAPKITAETPVAPKPTTGAPVYAVHYADGRAEFFSDWLSTKRAVRGSSGARHKKFAARAAADAWVRASQSAAPPAECSGPGSGPADVIYLYVDGSYSRGAAGWGWVAVDAAGVAVAENYGHVRDAPSRNIDGELQAAAAALEWWCARRAEWPRAVVCHDYMGIREWPAGAWRAESAAARQYVAACDARELRQCIGATLFFRHVRGHSGDTWNDHADALAKKGAGMAIAKKDAEV